MSAFGAFAGVNIIYRTEAMTRTGPRLFPESKHRSKRIHKKLIKRFGGEKALVPAILQLPDGTVIMHPKFRAELEAKTKVYQP